MSDEQIYKWMSENKMFGMVRTEADSDEPFDTRYISQEAMITFLLKEPEQLDTLGEVTLQRAFTIFNTLWDKLTGGEFYDELGNKRHVVWMERNTEWSLLDGKKSQWISDILTMNPSRFMILIGDPNSSRAKELSFMDILNDQMCHQDFKDFFTM